MDVSNSISKKNYRKTNFNSSVCKEDNFFKVCFSLPKLV